MNPSPPPVCLSLCVEKKERVSVFCFWVIWESLLTMICSPPPVCFWFWYTSSSAYLIQKRLLSLVHCLGESREWTSPVTIRRICLAGGRWKKRSRKKCGQTNKQKMSSFGCVGVIYSPFVVVFCFFWGGICCGIERFSRLASLSFSSLGWALIRKTAVRIWPFFFFFSFFWLVVVYLNDLLFI